MKSIPFIIVAAFCSVYGTPDASKWDAPRNFYEEIDAGSIERIKVERIEKELEAESGATFSPNAGYWFHTEGIKEKKQYIVISSDEGQYLITLKEPYPSFSTQISWVNEKIVFIRVYWGRIQGVDMLFDSEVGEFIYRESLVDGSILYQQTKQALER